MSTSLKTLAPSGRIAEELPCVHCGFLLRGLSISGRCPECGTGIRESMSASVLANPDYAREGLEDYGTSLKFAIVALLGLVTIPILGPFAALIVVGAGLARVSALERLRQAGATASWALRRHLQLARPVAWLTAILGAAVTILLLHDSLLRWGKWASPTVALAVTWIWMVAVWIEVFIASAFLLRAAELLEVAWFRWYVRMATALVVAGLIMRLLFLALGGLWQPQGGAFAAMALLEIVLGLIPIVVGGWMIGGAVGSLAGVAAELHWLGSRREVALGADQPRAFHIDAPGRAEERRAPAGGARGESPSRPDPHDDAPIPLD